MSFGWQAQPSPIARAAPCAEAAHEVSAWRRCIAATAGELNLRSAFLNPHIVEGGRKAASVATPDVGGPRLSAKNQPNVVHTRLPDGAFGRNLPPLPPADQRRGGQAVSVDDRRERLWGETVS